MSERWTCDCGRMTGPDSDWHGGFMLRMRTGENTYIYSNNHLPYVLECNTNPDRVKRHYEHLCIQLVPGDGFSDQGMWIQIDKQIVQVEVEEVAGGL